MAQMDFFRRPQLAGYNITRLKAATVRGSIRRSDPDGFAAYPYFPGVVAAQTLDLDIDGTPFSVAVTGNGLSTILDDINTLIGAAGYAYAEDGVIAIQTSTGDATGSIQVTGGTAAAALGFDISLGEIRSTGGDIPSTPEGRVGNWLGVSFPNKNDNLTNESLTRSLARLAGNLDVLFSEHIREDALPKKVTFTTSDGQTLTPNSADDVRVFTGLGLLSASSTKEELAPFFFLVDTATKLPPASRVVGIVRGAPGGLPPYADATTWTGGGSTGNVLGVDLTKSSGTITSIKNGRVVYVSGADFVTDKVRAGDYVEITGATNLTPWSNNGYRWVVEEVIDLEHIAVRPMSSSELAQVGTVSTEAQPIVELNMTKTGIEVYGSVNVKTGTYTNDVRVIVDPPIPTGATYDLYLSSPGDLRSKLTYESQAKDVANREWASDLRPSPNVLLTSPTVSSWSAASVILTSGYARFSDRVVSVPAKTFVAADFSNLGVNYVYWDKDTNEVKTTRSHVKVVNSDPTQSPGSAFPADTQAPQHIIAEVWLSGANISSVLFEGKAVGEEAAHRVVTVGVGGQFSKLEDAVRFVNRWAKGNSFRSSTYPQYEIVIVSDTTIDFSTITSNGNDYGTNSIFFDVSVKVRGASPNVKLILKNYVSGTPFDLGWSGYALYMFEDLNITFADSTFASVGLFFARANTHVFFKNITIPYYYDVGGFLSSIGSTVVIDTCSFSGLKSYFLSTGASSSSCDFEVFNSKIEMHPIAVNAAPCIFYGSVVGNTFTANKLVVRDCVFTRLQTDQGYSGLALMGKFGYYTVFDGCKFSRVGVNPAAQDSVLFKQQYVSGGLFISKCQSDAPTRCFIDAGSQEGYCYIDSCNISVEPDVGNPGIRAGSVTNSNINGSGGTTPTLAAVSRRFAGNYVSGSASIGVRNDLTNQSTSNFFADISYNRFQLSGGISILVKSADGWNNNGVSVHGNQILVQGTGAVGIQTWESTDVLVHGDVSGNIIRIRTGDGVSNKIGIYARGSCALIGNQVFNAFSESTFTSGHIGIRLDSATATRVVGNSVIFSAGNYTCMSVEGAQHAALIHNNVFESTGTALSFTGGATSTSVIVSCNRFIGTVAAVALLSAYNFNDNYVGGAVTSPTPGQFHSVDGNNFLGTVTLNGQAGRGAAVSNNSFSGALTLGGSYVDFFGNVVGDNLSTFSSVNAYQNTFIGPSAVIGFQFSSFVIADNVFSGLSQTITIDGTATVVGNRFVGSSLQTLNFGDSSFSGNSYYQEFKDNWCTCVTNLYSDYSTTMIVEGNYLGGVTTIGEVDRFNSNFLSLSGTGVNLIGRRSIDSAGRASAVGNVLYGGGTSTFTDMLFSGCSIRPTAGSASFTGCDFTGCDINTTSATTPFSNCRIVGGSLVGTGISSAGGATGGLSIDGVKAPSGLGISVTVAGSPVRIGDSTVIGDFVLSSSVSTHLTIGQMYVSGTFTFSDTSGSMKASGLHVAGSFTASLSFAEMANCRLESTFSMTTTGNFNAAASILGTSTSTVTVSQGFLTGCWFGSSTFILGSGVVAASNIGAFTLRSGTVTGCRTGVATLGAANVADWFTRLALTNSQVNGEVYVNPYSAGTVSENQRVIISGNNITPSFAVFGDGSGSPIAAIFVQRGRGVIVTGNTIRGPALCMDVGTVAQSIDIIIEGNHFIGQMGAMYSPDETFSGTSSGFGTLANGTYRYLLIVIYSAGGTVNNRSYYSKSSLTGNIVLGGGPPNNGVDLNVTPFTFTAPAGYTYIGYEIWRTADAGVTWYDLTASITPLNFLGNTFDYGIAGVLGTPILTTATNNTNDKPIIRMNDTYRSRIMNNIMDKYDLHGNDASFIMTMINAKGTLIGNNHFTGALAGISDDANTGTNEDDTYWTAAPTTTYSASGATGSGGTRRP